MGGERFLLTAVCAAIVHGLADLQHRSGLHHFLDACRIVHAGQLDQNLVLANALFLNHRLGNAQLVDTVADGFNRLLDGARLERASTCELQGHRPGVLGPRNQVVFGELVGQSIERRSPAAPMSTPRRVMLCGLFTESSFTISPKATFFFFSASFNRSIV